MDSVQTILSVVIVSLTLLLVVVGVQVIFIITEARRAIKKLNSLLDDSLIGGGLLRPEKLTGVLEMFKRRKKSHLREKGNIDK